MSRNLDSFLPKSEQTPRDAGSPVLWYDGDDTSARILTGSNEIFGGFEKSRYENRLEQIDVTATNWPSVGTIGARAGMQGSTLNGLRAAGTAVPTVEYTSFAVYSDNDDFIHANNTNEFWIRDDTVKVSDVTSASQPKLTDGEAHIIMVRWGVTQGATPGDVVVKFDDDDAVIVGNTTTRVEEVSFWWNIGNSVAANLGTTGVVGEVIVYPTFLPDFQVNRLGKYLCVKWNLLWSDV